MHPAEVFMPIQIIMLGTAFSLLWASAFVAGKVAIDYVDPITLLSPRFAVAGFLMIAAVLLSSGIRKFGSGGLLRDALILGLLNNAAYLGLSFWGLRTISPEATIFIVSMAPLMTSVIVIIGGRRYALRHFAGIIVAIGGIYVVLSTRMREGEDLFGMGLVLAATVAFSCGTIWYSRHATHHDPVVLNGLQNLAAGLMLLPFAQNFALMPAALGQPGFVLSFVHLIVGVSIVDFLMWLALLRKLDAGTASSFHLLNPVFGILLAWLVIGSPLMLTDFVGAIVILAGLSLVMRPAINRPENHAVKKGR